MAVADVQLWNSRSTGHEGAVETRKEPTITFSLSAMQMAARVVREYHSVDETTRT